MARRRVSRKKTGDPEEHKKVSAKVEPLSDADALAANISSTMIPPAVLTTLVEKLIHYERSSWEPDEFAAFTGRRSVVDLIFNSAFIRKAARQGYVFFVGADNRVYRHSVNSPIRAAPTPTTIKSVSVVEEIDYYVKPTWYEDLAAFIDAGTPTLLIGPPGSGKTLACERIFAERNQPLHIVSCNPSMTSDDLEGRIELRNDGGATTTRFEPGTLTVASKTGEAVLLDEADAIPAAAAFGVFRLLAGKDMRILRMGEGGVIPRHKKFRIVGTQNTEGRGDDKGLHHGRSYQDEAFLDRWENVIRVDYPHKTVEVDIIRRKTGLDVGDAERIIQAAGLLRKALNEDAIMFCCSMRRTLAVAHNMMRGHTVGKSWEYSVVNRATREDAKGINEILNRVYGDSISK